MGIIDELYIRRFHESKFEKYGSDNSHSLGWFSEESQLKRFGILSQIGDLNDRSILDIGCGNGDLCRYLNENYKNIYYSGIDLISTFLDNAVELNKNYPNTKFYQGDFMNGELPEADYVFACGSLNYKNTDPEFIFKAISRLFSYSKVGFGFNLLSETINQDGILATYDPEIIENYCKTLSSDIALKTNYEKGDFTIMLYKN